MKLFSYKETLKETIPLMALFVAINLILIAAGTYIPFAGYLFILFLPLVSSLYSIYTDLKYYPIYMLITLSLGLLVSIGDLSYVFSYLIPALIIGIFYKLAVNKKINGILTFFISTIILSLFEFIGFKIFDLLFNTNSFEIIFRAFGVITTSSTQEEIDIALQLSLGILYIFSSIESLIIYFVTNSNLEKFGYKIEFVKIDIKLNIISIGAILLGTIFSIFKIYIVAYYLLLISFMTYILLSIEIYFNKNKIMYFVPPISFIIGWIIYIIVLQQFSPLTSALFLFIISLITSISSLIYKLNVK